MICIKFIFYILFLSSLVNANLLKPGNNQILHGIHVLFEWKQAADASEYNLQISQDNTFNHILLDVTIEDNLYIDKTILEWQNSYYWRVRPIEENQSEGEWSEIYIFSISNSQFSNFDILVRIVGKNDRLWAKIMFFINILAKQGHS